MGPIYVPPLTTELLKLDLMPACLKLLAFGRGEMGGSVFGQIQVGFRHAGTSVDSVSGAASIWGFPAWAGGSPGTELHAGALRGAALPPRPRCLPRRALAATVEARREQRVEKCQGEAANLIAELKGFVPRALSRLRAMSGRAFPSPACSCPSRSAT